MNKQALSSSKWLETGTVSQSDNNGLKSIADSLSQLPSDVIDRMLAQAAQELEKRKMIEKDEAIIKIIEIVKKHSIPFDEITKILEETGAIYANHSDNGRTRRIFVDPDNPKNIWTGVGRKPFWFKALEAKGGDLEQYKTYF